MVCQEPLHRGKIDMHRSQGRYFSPQEISKIKYLLSTTDLTLEEISLRMDCAKSSIASINRNFGIREYRGRRRYWVCATAQDTTAPTEQQTDLISGTPN
jgi:hypothetical protein